MENKDIIYIILTKLNIFDITKCSTINKLFYSVYNINLLWMIKLGDYFGNYTSSLENYTNYKEICLKYYDLQRLTKTIKCKTHSIQKLSKSPKLPHDAKFITKYYDFVPQLSSKNEHITKYRALIDDQCIINDHNYLGFQNIKICLTTKQKIDDPIIELINKIHLKFGSFCLRKDSYTIKVEHEINQWNEQNISYKKHDLWHYEINLPFGIAEPLLLSMRRNGGNKQTITIYPNNKKIICDINMVMVHVALKNESIERYLKTMTHKYNYSLRYNYSFRYLTTASVLESIYNADTNRKKIMLDISVRTDIPMLGIVFYLMDKKTFRLCKLNFGSITLIIKKRSINLERKEIIKFNEDIYYIPIVPKLWEKCGSILLNCQGCPRKKILLFILNIEQEKEKTDGSLVCKFVEDDKFSFLA